MFFPAAPSFLAAGQEIFLAPGRGLGWGPPSVGGFAIAPVWDAATSGKKGDIFANSFRPCEARQGPAESLFSLPGFSPGFPPYSSSRFHSVFQLPVSLRIFQAMAMALALAHGLGPWPWPMAMAMAK